jgi:hypothetical protein
LIEIGADKKPIRKGTIAVARHPQFNLKTMLAHRATADVVLIRLATSLNMTAVQLLPQRLRVTVGERFVVRRYGASVRGDGNSAGKLRG